MVTCAEMTLQDAMLEAEGAMWRFLQTGKRYLFPCGAMRELAIKGRRFSWQIQFNKEGRAELYLNLVDWREQSPSWKLTLDKYGFWDVAIYSGGATVDETEWKLDSAITRCVAVRNEVSAASVSMMEL